MKVTYVGTGARDDDAECAVFGMTFKLGESVDVSALSPEQQELLDGNPTFTTDGKKKLSLPATAPAAPAANPQAPSP